MTIPHQAHSMLHQVANETTLNQNRQMNWFQGSLSQCIWRWYILLCCGTIHQVPELCKHPFPVPLPPPTYRFGQVGRLIVTSSSPLSKFCFGRSLWVSDPSKVSWSSKFWVWGIWLPMTSAQVLPCDMLSHHKYASNSTYSLLCCTCILYPYVHTYTIIIKLCYCYTICLMYIC
jgi:hypothetical protein